eukprot:CAMPEP_0170316344 /NCGR_PEP_ID=MMETSP0116_2-20130129/58802_1 /TAXON_ID=400756 /ORGANISM="Durinskia baltica, Strain CSIRO CS-38" /LENGTH=56 /DNA_ID=CAMNT_0010568907 /DNA_START=10 /DNA_END=176 /DNA_ORIENTATION=-
MALTTTTTSLTLTLAGFRDDILDTIGISQCDDLVQPRDEELGWSQIWSTGITGAVA